MTQENKEPNIWLDDVRKEPDGWLRSKTARGCILRLSLLNMAGTRCDTLSLDHDLGEGLDVGNGYDVISWIEVQQRTNPKFVPPRKIVLHTQNPVAKARMELARKSIEDYEKQRSQ